MPVSNNRRTRKKLTSSKRFTQKSAKRYIQRFLCRFLMDKDNKKIEKSMKLALKTLGEGNEN